MSEQDIVLDSYDMFKAEDGYRNLTMLDNDPAWHAIVHAAMEQAGYTSYSMNRTGDSGKITFTFVTHARAAELQEQHHHSCRNSLGGVPNPVTTARVHEAMPQGRDETVGTSVQAAFAELPHMAIHDGLAGLR